MPTTFVGLALYTVFLFPGYVSYVQRRRLAPQRQLSPLLETISLLSVSVVANLVALCLFGVLRVLAGEHTPDLLRWMEKGGRYADERVLYLGAWSVGLLGVACLIAWSWATAAASTRVGRLAKILNPVIVDASTWYHIFEDQPDAPEGEQAFPYLGCTLDDGSFIAGRLTWYSTEVEETPDRELALVGPFTMRSASGKVVTEKAPIMILSARCIQRLTVTWVNEPIPP